MPQVTVFEVAKAGTYMAQLCDIEAKTAPQKNDKGESRDSTFWVWKFKGFRSNDKNKKSVPIEITTGTGISPKPSALKGLLMSAFPDMTPEEMRRFNTDKMIGKSWVLKVGVDQKQGGGDKNVILNIEASEEDYFAEADTETDEDEENDD